MKLTHYHIAALGLASMPETLYGSGTESSFFHPGLGRWKKTKKEIVYHLRQEHYLVQSETCFHSPTPLGTAALRDHIGLLLTRLSSGEQALILHLEQGAHIKKINYMGGVLWVVDKDTIDNRVMTHVMPLLKEIKRHQCYALADHGQLLAQQITILQAARVIPGVGDNVKAVERAFAIGVGDTGVVVGVRDGSEASLGVKLDNLNIVMWTDPVVWTVV